MLMLLSPRIVFSLIAFCFFTVTHSQNIKSENITYYFYRLPSEPIDKKYTNYQIKIEAPYEAKNEQLTKEYESNKKSLKERYINDSINYSTLVKAAEDKYDKEMEAYKKKTFGTRLLEKSVLGENNKPVKDIPTKPYLETLSPPLLKTQYDHELLASTYLKMHGYNNIKENAVQLTITLFGFDYTQPQTISAQKDMIRVGNGTSTYKATYYHTEFSYRHPMSIKVVLPNATEILNITPQELNIYQVYKSLESDNYQSFNSELLVKGKEEETLQDNLTFIGDLLNDRFGTSAVKRAALLYYVKSKGDEYADLTLAFNEASSALQMLRDDSTSAKQKLVKAIDTWKIALKESDPFNKKARIDKDVTIVILFNLLEASFAAADTASATIYLDQLNTLSLDSGERKTKNELERLFADLKKRQNKQIKVL